MCYIHTCILYIIKTCFSFIQTFYVTFSFIVFDELYLFLDLSLFPSHNSLSCFILSYLFLLLLSVSYLNIYFIIYFLSSLFSASSNFPISSQINKFASISFCSFGLQSYKHFSPFIPIPSFFAIFRFHHFLSCVLVHTFVILPFIKPSLPYVFIRNLSVSLSTLPISKVSI